MAARKLQSEIDRTLKKVTEGVELFESIYDKMQASTNQTQKEKLETDLKTQIKKLQRLRDQIKTWITGNDIKDKSALLDTRRLIETQMEKFKACEKEMKTKAFSKEGLTQASKLDPKQQEKLETTQWLQNQVEELSQQVEMAEAEIETLQGGAKKKHKAGQQAERLESLEHLNERRKWHINRLELILRLLDNGSMPVEKVNDLKEDVSYFVENNADDNYNEDEGIYDELNLDEEEEKFGLAQDDHDSDDSEDASEDLPPRTPSKSKHHDEESVTSSKRDGSPVLKKATTTLQLRKPSIASETAKPPPPPNFEQKPMASILKAGLDKPQIRPAPLPVRYAAAAAAAVAPANPPPQSPATATPSTSNQSSAPVAPPISTTLSSADQVSAAATSPSLTHPSLTSPVMSSAASNSAAIAEDSIYDSPSLSEAPVASTSPAARNGSPSVPFASQPPVESRSVPIPNGTAVQQQSGPSPLVAEPQSYPATQLNGASALQQTSQQQSMPHYPPGVKEPSTDLPPPGLASTPQQQAPGARPTSTAPQQVVPQQTRPNVPSGFPGSLSDLVMSFENVKQKAPHRMSNLEQVHKLLEGSYSTMPQPQDTEKPKYYVPKHPINTPSYYPQAPSPILNTPAIFSQLDVETLFYVFYFHPGTYQQYLAAKELKRQSWRFHVKYLTWFQRHSEPQAITEEYEQGVYVYFDWEGSWCQRKKSDFRFEYRYLSED
ncbi:Not1 N-terminal domain, CCR4-Not complex component-domain-containing protein [Irpex rosettiformis]|uniref:Not1 N-terminal domain, CCR4-Not complex component-domain-containing protein n=1 Tax=Irpex rosettiformis TaxID=378272 RepID=A0ACB8UC92_9APHY|nr:Not1 N-terminal domain, CCR4-Not complex component-domain-containing protein [Irpex rosettiformis]